MASIPFLKPSLPTVDKYLTYLQSIDSSKKYSNFGPLTLEFESRLINEWCGSGYGVTVCNATLGLMIAINAVKNPSGTVAILPSFTFAATAQAARWCGLELYYVDIEPSSWAMDSEKLQLAIEEVGADLAVVIPYATFGISLDLNDYQKLIEQSVPVVVDAAPGFGTTTESGEPFGQGFDGAIVYSFHATKPFGIGEGGFVYSNSKQIIDSIRLYSNFGFSKPGISEGLGLNSKLSEYAAAVGLAVLDTFKEKKQLLETLYVQYLTAFADNRLYEQGAALQVSNGGCVHQFFPLLIPEHCDKTKVMEALLSSGVEVRSYFDPPCHLQQDLGSAFSHSLEVTHQVSQRIICLPLWSGMTANEVEFVVKQFSLAITA